MLPFVRPVAGTAPGHPFARFIAEVAPLVLGPPSSAREALHASDVLGLETPFPDGAFILDVLRRVCKCGTQGESEGSTLSPLMVALYLPNPCDVTEPRVTLAQPLLPLSGRYGHAHLRACEGKCRYRPMGNPPRGLALPLEAFEFWEAY